MYEKQAASPRQIELKTPPYSELCEFAKRIAQLLELAKIQSSPYPEAILDDLLGVVYSLIFASELGFEDRPDRPVDVNAVRVRATQLSKGLVREEGKWMAGFYFNSALFRLSAVYDRTLKIVAGTQGDLKDRRRRAKEFHPDWNDQNVHSIHLQANGLKHETSGIYEARRKDAGYRNAVSAVRELLALIEAWSAKL